MQEENNGALNNDDIINNNKPHLLEILACDETLQDFEKYLLDRGFDEMMNCITSDNTNEKQQFNKFFEYFGIIIQNKQEDVIINTKNKFIDNLKKYLQKIKNDTNQIEKKNQLLAIIAVALQNCKLRSVCTPESQDYTKTIGKNLISLLSQAQYFLRYAKDCKVAWKTRCFNKNGFIETDDAKYKTTDIIDANNFLYRKLQSKNMILTKTEEETNMKELATKHFSKISKTIYEKNKQMQENDNLNIETTIPTASLWGTEQNTILLEEYNKLFNKNTNNFNQLQVTINTTNIKSLLENKTQEWQKAIAEKLGKNIRIYNYENNYFIIQKDNGDKIATEILNNNTYPYNTNKQRTIYVNAGDHLAFTGNEGYMFFQNQQDISKKNYTSRPSFVSLDVNMASTEFFRFFGANGQLCHGFFTFNNNKTDADNFNSLNMPNTFLFKGKTIDARRVIEECNNISPTYMPQECINNNKTNNNTQQEGTNNTTQQEGTNNNMPQESINNNKTNDNMPQEGANNNMQPAGINNNKTNDNLQQEGINDDKTNNNIQQEGTNNNKTNNNMPQENINNDKTDTNLQRCCRCLRTCFK